jgi:oleate hydratase
MSIVVPYQPHFPAMPEDTYTLWGYGLLVDADGDYVKKKMSQASGEEILTELIGQLGFDDIGPGDDPGSGGGFAVEVQ